MKKNEKSFGKKLIAGSVLLVGLSTVAFAGPVGTGTANFFSSDADNIMSTTGWSSVELDKALVSAVYSASGLNITAGTKIGDIVIAANYEGNIFADKNTSTAKDTVTNITDAKSDTVIKTQDVKTYVNNGETKTFNNKPTVLLGFGMFGVKVGVGFTNSDYDGTLGTDFNAATDSVTTITDNAGNVYTTVSTTYNKKGYVKDDHYIPEVEVGTSLAVGDISITPVVGFAADIGVNSAFAEKTELKNPNTKYEYSAVSTATRNNITAALKPAVSVDFAIPTGDFTSTISAGYKGQFNIYSAEYTDAFGAKAKASTAKVTKDSYSSLSVDGSSAEYANIAANLEDTKNVTNGGSLYYKLSGAMSDQLSFAVNLGADFSISNKKNTSWTSTTTKQVTTDIYGMKTTTETTTTGSKGLWTGDYVNVEPTSSFGFVYQAVPSKLNILAGTKINLPKLSYSATNWCPAAAGSTKIVNTDANGNVTTTTTVSDSWVLNYPNNGNNGSVKTAEWSAVSGKIYTGLQWFMSDNFEVDVAWEMNTSSGFLNGNVTAGAILKF